MTEYITPVLSNLGLTLSSTLFMAFAIAIFRYKNLYNKNSIKVIGKIVGIEKFVSSYRSGQTKTKRIMYRSIVSFIYNGEKLYFKAGISQNTIAHRIGQEVKVEYIQNLPSSVRIAGQKIYSYLGLGFLLISIILMTINFRMDEFDINLKLIRLAIPFVLNIFLYRYLTKYINKHGGISEFFKKNNPIKSREELNNLNVFWRNDEISKEESKVYKPFLIITPVLIGIAGWIGYVTSIKFFNRSIMEKVYQNDNTQLEGVKKSLDFIMGNSTLEKEFLIICTCTFFVVMLTYSLIFTLIKVRR
jgi:hypothetical protein